MKTKLLFNKLKQRERNLFKVNTSIEVLIFNIRIISHLPGKKGPIYYIYIF